MECAGICWDFAAILQRGCWATLYFALEPICTMKTINMTPLLGSYAKYTVFRSPHTPSPCLEHHQQRPAPISTYPITDFTVNFLHAGTRKRAQEWWPHSIYRLPQLSTLRPSAAPCSRKATMHQLPFRTVQGKPNSLCWLCVRKTIPHAITTTTSVLIAVVRCEFTPSIPTFARIEVKAAKIDDKTARIIHIFLFPCIYDFLHRATKAWEHESINVWTYTHGIPEAQKA